MDKEIEDAVKKYIISKLTEKSARNEELMIVLALIRMLDKTGYS